MVVENVLKCSLLRGWKSVTELLTDQGIISTYIKNDTKVYYRSYCEQEDGSYLWEIEQEITEFVPPVSSIQMFLAADYRVGFLAEINGAMQLLLTTRSWSGMAILPEHLTINMVSATIDVTEILYADYKHDDCNIGVSFFSAEVISFGGYDAGIV